MGQPGFLFTPTVPEGFHYRADFLTAAEEDHLAAALERIPFADFEMRGVVARRRVAFFGHSYGHDVVPPVPEFLLPLRAAVAMWAGIEPAAYVMALVNEYRPGASLLPPMSDLRIVAATVAMAVARTAEAQGLARNPMTNPINDVYNRMWKPDYPTLDILPAVQATGSAG